MNKDGGSLYLECPFGNLCNYTIIDSTFINNSAFINGGAIKYTYTTPLFIGNNTFINNSA
jgi:predicted outer membrane repeat protein